MAEVRIRMSKSEVKRNLGPPGAELTASAFVRFRRALTALVLRSSYDEAWMYHDHPPGHNTMLVFSGRRLVNIDSRPKY